jgi:hypothetical protein
LGRILSVRTSHIMSSPICPRSPRPDRSECRGMGQQHGSGWGARGG